MAKTPSDPKRAQIHDLIIELSDHLQLLRDYALTPGSTWLAKGELEMMTRLLSDLDELISEVKASETA